MAKKVKEDLIKWELDINASPAQKSLRATAVETNNFEKQNKDLEKQLKALKKAGKEGSDEWNTLSKTYSENTTAIDKNRQKMDELYKSMDNSEKTTAQLRNEYYSLRKELDNMTRGTEEYKAKSAQLTSVQRELQDAQGQQNLTMGNSESIIAGITAKSALLTGAFIALGMKIVGVVSDFVSMNNIMSSNQTTGDELANEMHGLQRAMETLQVRIANLDFKGLVRDMIDTYNTGKEVSAMLDEIFERDNSFKISSAQQAAQLSILQEKMRDVNLSYKERQEAANEIIRITREQSVVEKDIANQKAEAYKKDLQARTKLTDKELEYVVDRYNENRTELEQASKLIELQQKLKNLKNDTSSIDATTRNIAIAKSKDLENEIVLLKMESNSIEKTAEILNKYNRSNDELVQNYVESRVKAITVQSTAEQSLLRVKTTSNSLQKQIADDQRKVGEEAAKRAKDKIEAEIEQSELEKKTAEEQLKVKADLLNKISAMQNEYDISQLSAEDQRLIQLSNKYQQVQSELDKAFANKLLSEEEYNNQSRQLQELHAKEELSIIEANREKITETVNEESKRMDADAYRIQQELLTENLEATRDMELAALDELHAAKKLSDEEYAKASMNVQLKYIQNRLQKEKQLLSNAAKVSESLQDLALAKVETRYQKELSAAGDNEEQKAAIEENYEKDKLEVQKKYADINFAIKASQIIADTAVSIMQGYAQLGPIGGSITAALLTTIGAIQLGIANQERQRIKSMTWSGSSSKSSSETSNAITGNVVLKEGFSEGGPTGDNIGVKEIAGVVHGQEYVIPAWQMKMPETVEMVKVLESIRRSKGSSMNVSQSSGSMNGYESGGEVQSSDSGVVVPSADFRSLVAALNSFTKEPLKAYVLLSELEKAQKRQEISRKKSSKI